MVVSLGGYSLRSMHRDPPACGRSVRRVPARASRATAARWRGMTPRRRDPRPRCRRKNRDPAAADRLAGHHAEAAAAKPAQKMGSARSRSSDSRSVRHHTRHTAPRVAPPECRRGSRSTRRRHDHQHMALRHLLDRGTLRIGGIGDGRGIGEVLAHRDEQRVGGADLRACCDHREARNEHIAQTPLQQLRSQRRCGDALQLIADRGSRSKRRVRCLSIDCTDYPIE